jgi:hypothetical protein
VIWLISGSRTFPDPKLAKAVLRSQFSRHDIVIHGQANGVDRWAEEVANEKECIIEAYPAEWDKHGKSAGPIRNRQMFEAARGYMENTKDSVRALILWDGESRGTAHMLGLVEEFGMPLTLIRCGHD